MESTIVGQLKVSEYDSDFFESSPFEIPYFDNKKLKVGFIEAQYQPYLVSADKVLENFLKLNSNDKFKDSEIVIDYYNKTLKNGYTRPLDIKTTHDVWNFVTPIEIIIHWDEDENFYLCVSCKCEWEVEHGLELVFKNGETLTSAVGHG